MVKSRVGAGIHQALQNAVVAAINDTSYGFELPELTDWESVVSSTTAEKERLEFVGDAVMHLAVALYLYQLFPSAHPGLYSNIRSAVNTNATFTHLMAKTGAYKLPSQPCTTKAAADSFEVIVAAMYFQCGFTEVCAWVREQYAPLIAAAKKSYEERVSKGPSTSAVLNTPSCPSKRRSSTSDLSHAPIFKKIKVSSVRLSPRRTLMASRVIRKMKSRTKVKLYLPTKKARLPLEMRLRSCEVPHPSSHSQSDISQVIDLTVDSESEHSQIVPVRGRSTNHSSCFDNTFQPSSSGGTSVLELTKPSPPAPRPMSIFRCPPTPGGNMEQPAPSTALVHSPLITRETFEFSKQSGLSLPSECNVSAFFGGPDNPIIIDESDSEES